jgi:hypothetical protein
MLRERRYATLLIMQDDAIDIEGNMTTSRKIKVKIDQIDKDKKKLKDEVGTSGAGKDSQEAKLEEMSRLIRNLSNKLSRLETEGILQINLLMKKALGILISLGGLLTHKCLGEIEEMRNNPLDLQ